MKLPLRNMVGGFLVVASLSMLSACSLMRVAGPCYGYGCPAMSSGGNSAAQPPKNAALTKPAAANAAQASAQSSNQASAKSSSNQGN